MNQVSTSSGDLCSATALFLGIDGGGTKTQVLIGRSIGQELKVLGAGQGGPSNPRAVGFEAAFVNITAAIVAAWDACGLSKRPIDHAAVCLAGAGREDEQAKVRSWMIEQGIALRVRMISEAEAVLAAARCNNVEPCFSKGDEISCIESEVALICGTGSLAWGRRTDQTTRVARCGGWGYLLGDEGSGYWIGQQLLQLACRAADSRSKDELILHAVLQHLSLQTASELVGWCYGDKASRNRIANLAKLAFELRAVDAVAEIIDRAASELALMIAAVIEQLEVHDFSLAVAGSVVVAQTEFQRQILARLNERSFSPKQFSVVSDPVRGALRLAIGG